MAVAAVHTAPIDLTDHRHQRCFRSSSQPIEPLELLTQPAPIQRLENLGIEVLLDPDRNIGHLVLRSTAD